MSAFDTDSFDKLGRCDTERESINCLAPEIDRLIAQLNRLPCCERMADFRDRWAERRKRAQFFADKPFGDTDYIHGGRAHWYIYHRGGRWEPEMNVGMFGAGPGGRRYLRAGIGFSLTLNSRDPDRASRLQALTTLFANFRAMLHGPLRPDVLRALTQQPRPTLEHDGAVPDTTLITPVEMVDWIANWHAPSGWVFLGTRLVADDEADRRILGDWRSLTASIEAAFSAWEPLWYEIWSGGA